MCRPERPRTDEYDNNEQIDPHFSLTPGLTPLSRKDRHYEEAKNIKHEIGELYSKHGFSQCPNYGLHWAGYPLLTSMKERTKTLLLVFELREWDIKQWWKVDDDVRKILEKLDPNSIHQVCVRYYQHWDERLEQAYHETQNARREAIRARRSTARAPSSRHDTTAASDEFYTTRLWSDMFDMSSASTQRALTNASQFLDYETVGLLIPQASQSTQPSATVEVPDL